MFGKVILSSDISIIWLLQGRLKEVLLVSSKKKLVKVKLSCLIYIAIYFNITRQIFGSVEWKREIEVKKY